MLDLTTYLFVDGQYLRTIYSQAMRAVFGVDGQLDFQKIYQQSHCLKAFVYECPDEKLETETDAEFRVRNAPQAEYFSKIAALRGFHLQQGTMRGGRKR